MLPDHSTGVPSRPGAAASPVSTALLTAEIGDLVTRFLAGRPEGRVSVWAGLLDGSGVAAYDEHGTHYAASTMKLPLLVAAYRRHERGDLDLDAEVPVHNAFPSAADGSLFSLDQDEDQDDETWSQMGSRAPLRELARRAVVRSGNLATNLLLEHVGAGEVASVLADAGCTTDTVLPRGIGDAVARESGLDNLVTAHDLGQVMRGIAAGLLAGPEASAAVEAVVAGQEHRDKIPAGLPAGTYVANKTGWVEGVAHDVALVRPRHTAAYVLAVCTSVDVPESEASALVAETSRTVWRALT